MTFDVQLLSFIPKLSPEFREPYHLKEWCDLLEACLVRPVRAIMAVPIRHGKTETTLHGIAWLLTRDPSLRIIMFTFDHERAQYLGWRVRQLCEAAGVGPEKGSNIMVNWRNAEGGGVTMMSAKQSRLGQDVDVLIFDDPLTEHDAHDKTVRDKIDLAIAHYTARVGRPGRPGSVLGIMSRWHPDDPIGRRISRGGWEVIQHPALTIDENGVERAWAPDIMSVEDLKSRRKELQEADPGERIWYAQFQNDPLPDSLGLFGQPVTYDELPGYGRYVIGIDLAYSTESAADYFAMVALRCWEGVTYIVNVWREQRNLDMAAQRIRFAKGLYPGATIYSYVSGPEKGAITYLSDRNIPVEAMQARYDKGTRARKTIDAWNKGLIRVPAQGSWVSGFVSRCRLFTGHPKAFDDDEIDALVSACDGGVFAAPAAPTTTGRPRIGRY